MIINKKFAEIKGYVCYEIFLEEKRTIFDHDCDCEEDFELTEYEHFASLQELDNALSLETRKEIKEQYETEYNRNCTIELVNVTFIASSQDKKTETRFSLDNNMVNGWATVEINNNDVENRLLTNLEQVKRIIDNTLEEYPIKYTRE